MIQGLGLQGTVEAITAAAAKAGTPLQGYISSIEGQTLAMAGASAQAADWTAKTEQMAGAAGATEQAFAEVADTTQFKLTNALNKAKAAGIELGATIAPAVEGAANAVVGLLDAFDRLPGPVQNGVVVIGGLAAAAGPAVWGLGKLASATGSVIGAVKGGKEQFDLFRLGMQGASQAGDGLAAGLGRNLTPALVGAGGVVAALGIATLAWQAHSRQQQEARARADELRGAIDQQTGALTENADALLLNKFQSRNQMDDLQRAGIAWNEVTAAVAASNDESLSHAEVNKALQTSEAYLLDQLDRSGGARDRLLAKLIREGEASTGLVDNLYEQYDAYDNARGQIEATTAATEDATDATDWFSTALQTMGGWASGAAGDVDEIGAAARDAAADVDRLTTLLFGPADAELGYQSALLAEEDAKHRITDAQQRLTDARNEHGWVSEEAAAAERELRNAELGLQRAQLGTVRSALELQGALSQQEQAAGELNEEFGGMQSNLAELAAQFPEVTGNAWLLSAALNDLERERLVRVRVQELWDGGIFGAGGGGGFLGDALGGIGAFARKAIPAAADGAVVSATPGGSLVQVGEAGTDEAIVPLTDDVLARMGGGGVRVEQTNHHHYNGVPVDQAVELSTARTKRDLAAATAAAMVGGS
jgi:hypothetical protein